jgi:membrane protein
VLPDAKIKWRDVVAGAMITAVLFMIGKFGISLYISTTSVGSTYGAAGALVILIVWTYYSSLILYFGAEITKNYALKYGSEIKPAEYAVAMKQVEVEEGKKPLQEVQGKEHRKAT